MFDPAFGRFFPLPLGERAQKNEVKPCALLLLASLIFAGRACAGRSTARMTNPKSGRHRLDIVVKTIAFNAVAEGEVLKPETCRRKDELRQAAAERDCPT